MVTSLQVMALRSSITAELSSGLLEVRLAILTSAAFTACMFSARALASANWTVRGWAIYNCSVMVQHNPLNTLLQAVTAGNTSSSNFLHAPKDRIHFLNAIFILCAYS